MERDWTMTKGVLAWLGLTMMAVAAAAQTTVTTSGGTTNTVPVFTGSARVGNSPISVSGGNVGIGTTSPQYALDVSGQARLQSPANIDLAALGSDNAMYIRSAIYDTFSGFTGQGLSNVNDAGNGASLGYVAKFSAGWTAISTVNRTTGFGPGIYDVYVRMRSDNSGNGPNGIQLGLYDGTTGTYPLSASVPITASYQELYLGRVTIQAGSLGDGVVTFFSNSTDTTNYYLDYMKFVKAPLFVGGSVGIGTTSPNAKLEVEGGDVYDTSSFATGQTPPTRSMFMGTYNQFGLVAQAGMQTAFTRWSDADFASSLSFYTSQDNVPMQRMVVNYLGNVGIGAPNPGYKLDVVGQIHSSSGIVFPDGTTQTTAFLSGSTIVGGAFALTATDTFTDSSNTMSN
jgi:hypothetical protein